PLLYTLSLHDALPILIRREKVFLGKEAEIARLIESGQSSTPQSVSFSEDEIADDRLRMMFVCCHPVIPPEAQVALALKTLCGFRDRKSTRLNSSHVAI